MMKCLPSFPIYLSPFILILRLCISDLYITPAEYINLRRSSCDQIGNIISLSGDSPSPTSMNAVISLNRLLARCYKVITRKRTLPRYNQESEDMEGEPIVIENKLEKMKFKVEPLF